ncbi:MAG: hypothetical protein K2X28_01125 [Alphaproteobacteria bacterium]|nr:hypothetical protein [Alphaproteobacteria bacterium]
MKIVTKKKVIILLSIFQLFLLESVSVHAVPPSEDIVPGPSSGISMQPSFSGISPEEGQLPVTTPRSSAAKSSGGLFPGAVGEETFQARPLTIGRDEVAAMLERAEFEAISSGRQESYYLPVVPFEDSFWWGQNSTNITPEYLEGMGDFGTLIGETGGSGALRMLGTAKFLYIVLEAMDDPYVKMLTGPQMDAKAEAAIADFVFKRGGRPGAITPAELAVFGDGIKAQILQKSQPVPSSPVLRALREFQRNIMEIFSTERGI